MIESQLDPLTDGTGEGYGNYPGLTVAQVADRFRHLAAEGHSRSARAILRIVHEQTAARGALSVQRYLLAFGLIATAALVVLRLIAGEEHHHKLDLYLGAAVVVTAIFAVSAASVNRTARRNAAQVREIRRLALLALERVVEAPGFGAKPLEREHLRALDEMRKVDPDLWKKIARTLKN